jgi:hypothetical protein
MENMKAHHISPIPYISHAQGELLTHERRNHHRYNKVKGIHLKITVGIQNKKENKSNTNSI